jgi:hypothetical protein
MGRRHACRFLPIVVVIFALGCAFHRGPATAFRLQPGDLLLQDLDCGPLCDAIETVTRGVDGAHFSHVGIVEEVKGNSATVIEAVGAGVMQTPLEEFLARSSDKHGNPNVLVGRLRPHYRPPIPEALTIARTFLGLPYDRGYVIDNSSFYCSELIYEVFRVANGNQALFPLAPMTFKDPVNGETFPPWVEYYRELQIPVPEGEPGLNPGGISRSPAVEIVHAYGCPTGWRGRLPSRARPVL